MRFDLPAVPAGCQITGAQLRLFAGGAVDGRTLQALRSTRPWTEGGVTWANQPATTGAAATDAVGHRMAGVVRDLGGPGDVLRAATTDSSIRDASEGGAGFQQQLHSREKAPDNPPQLVITFGP